MAVCDIRLATTEAGLSNGYLIYSWGLPKPQVPLFSDHSVKSPLSSGGQALRGHSSVSLLFERLTAAQARALRKLVEDALDSTDGLMYLTVDKAWRGSGGEGSWEDVKGEPHIPDLAAAASTDGKLFQNVTLFVNAIQSVNDPASF